MRETDRELLKGLIEKLGGAMPSENNGDKSNIKEQKKQLLVTNDKLINILK